MAEIPLPQTQEQDVYSLGFDKSLNRTLSTIDSPVVYDTTADAINVGQVLTGGILTLKSLNIGGLVRQVAPGDDIQAAIDSVNREGGGTVQLQAGTYIMHSNIELRDLVHLKGAGRDVTDLEFEGRPFGVVMAGNASNILNITAVTDLAIINSSAPAGLDINYSDFFFLENLHVYSCDHIGIRITNSQSFSLINVHTELNTEEGIRAYFDSRSIRDATLVGIRSNDNGAASGDDGIFSEIGQAAWVGVRATDNGGNGLNLGAQAFECSIVGFNGAGNGNVAGNEINVTSGCTDSTIIGNTTASAIETNDTDVIVQANRTYGLASVRDVIKMINRSGAGLRAGNVVILDPTSASIASEYDKTITTTTTNGDDRVLGVAQETMSNTSTGAVIMQGFVTNLYVANGASSIVLGDFLSTYSHAYYAKKATSGETVFAIAMATPTTGTAAINALLIRPRLI